MSLKGKTYQRVKAHCEALGVSMGGWISDLIEADLDAKQIRGGGVHLL